MSFKNDIRDVHIGNRWSYRDYYQFRDISDSDMKRLRSTRPVQVVPSSQREMSAGDVAIAVFLLMGLSYFVTLFILLGVHGDRPMSEAPLQWLLIAPLCVGIVSFCIVFFRYFLEYNVQNLKKRRAAIRELIENRTIIVRSDEPLMKRLEFRQWDYMKGSSDEGLTRYPEIVSSYVFNPELRLLVEKLDDRNVSDSKKYEAKIYLNRKADMLLGHIYELGASHREAKAQAEREAKQRAVCQAKIDRLEQEKETMLADAAVDDLMVD